MSAFDNIIGYDGIKEELHQICDMVHNPELYHKLGARIPRGLMVHGRPGLGKSLMANALMEEMKRKNYIVRRNPTEGDFVKEMTEIFREAAKNTPSVILLDDMDKFPSTEDSKEEFTAVQACIDDIRDGDVFVIATVNDIDILPQSLLRAGRFDRKVKISRPEDETSVKIIQHYLKNKPVDPTMNFDDIAKMMNYCSCAELETILNEAAIFTGYSRRNQISTRDIVHAFLSSEYDNREYTREYSTLNESQKKEFTKTAYHEAGHILMMELTKPGSAGFAVISVEENSFTRCCNRLSDYEDRLMVHLAGMAATEVTFGQRDRGSCDDIDCALGDIRQAVTSDCLHGNEYSEPFYRHTSTELRSQQELVIHAEFDRALQKAKHLLHENRELLDAIASGLIEKQVLMHSDIKKIMESGEKKKGI